MGAAEWAGGRGTQAQRPQVGGHALRDACHGQSPDRSCPRSRCSPPAELPRPGWQLPDTMAQRPVWAEDPVNSGRPSEAGGNPEQGEVTRRGARVSESFVLWPGTAQAP